MTIDKLRFDQIRYNPERGAFEALVHVHDDGDLFVYPAHVIAPLHADFSLIAQGLAQRAASRHRTARPGMRLRRPACAEHRPLAA
jgi:hypothetical protein